MNNGSWVQEQRDTIYDSKHMQVYADKVRLGNGTVIDDYSVVRLNDGVLVVATDSSGYIIMLNEYKYAINETIICIPAGGLEDNEDITKAAIRELKEETGYESDEVSYVGYINEYPSKAPHKLHIVRIKNAVKNSPTEHESTEQIESICLLEPDKVVAAIRQQEIKLASTISAIIIAMPEIFSKA